MEKSFLQPLNHLMYCFLALSETFAPQEVPSLTPWGCEDPQLRTADLELQQAISGYWLSSWKQPSVDPHQTRHKFAY